MPYYVYILESLKDGSDYVGLTNNLEDRLRRHNEGRVAYTKPRRPWKLVYSEEHPDRSSAAKRESEIKAHKRRAFIEKINSEILNPLCFWLERPAYHEGKIASSSLVIPASSFKGLE